MKSNWWQIFYRLLKSWLLKRKYQGHNNPYLDTVTGCVVHTMLSSGTGYATIDLSIKMLRPVPKEVALLVEGTIISVTKSLGVSEGVLKDEAGKLYAHATATCMLLAN